MDKPELEFYDIKSKTKFKTTDWHVEMKESQNRRRWFGVAPAPDETERECWRILSAEFAAQYTEKEETEE